MLLQPNLSSLLHSTFWKSDSTGLPRVHIHLSGHTLFTVPHDKVTTMSTGYFSSLFSSWTSEREGNGEQGEHGTLDLPKGSEDYPVTQNALFRDKPTGKGRLFSERSRNTGYLSRSLPDVESSDSDDLDGKKSDTSGTDSETSESSNEGRRNKGIVTDVSRHRTRRTRSLSASRNAFRPGANERGDDFESKVEHIHWLSHGKLWTAVGVICAWSGLAFSCLARKTTAFVSVVDPIYIDSHFVEFHNVGMINFELCYNETTTGLSGCTLHALETAEVNDTMFQLSRSMAFMAMLLGAFVSVLISTAAFWQSINLRPVGLGFLVAYFFQSFTFLFFDTELCATYTCRIARGSVYSVVASFCWLFACVATSRMEGYKTRKQKLREINKVTSRSRSLSPQKEFQKSITRSSKATERETDSSSEEEPWNVSRLTKGVTKGRNMMTTASHGAIGGSGRDIHNREAWTSPRDDFSHKRLPLRAELGDSDSVYYDDDIEIRRPRGSKSRSRSHSRKHSRPTSSEKHRSRSHSTSRREGRDELRRTEQTPRKESRPKEQSRDYSNAAKASKPPRIRQSLPSSRRSITNIASMDVGTKRSRQMRHAFAREPIDNRTFEL